MNKLFVIVVLIVCGTAIIGGNLHWNNKIAAQSEVVTNTDNVAINKKEEQQKEVNISTYTSKLPENLKGKIKGSLRSGKPLQLVIYGSDATSDSKGAWPDLLKKQLMDTYGEDIFHISVISDGDQTTRDIVQEISYEKVSKLNPDVVLFEPFILNDNSGLIGVTNTIENIETMIKSWEAANKEVILLMQPSNPLHGAKFYPKQVDQIKEFAEENKIIYLNHWENWPDLNDEKMKAYLTEDSKPNGSGNKVWAEFLTNYFISK